MRPREGQSPSWSGEGIEEELVSNSDDSEVEDPQSFSIQDTLGPGPESVELAMDSSCKSGFEEWFPHGQELIHLVPSEGAKPPRQSLLMSQHDIPPPQAKPEFIPVIESPSCLHLPEGYSLVQKWNYLNHPDKPNFMATKIATSGLVLVWI